jgi:predicted TIM-barrel fold metal-dependent hydrolase
MVQDLHLWGVKMHPREHGYPVNHWTVRQILDKLLALQRQAARPLVVLVHAAADSNYNTPEALGAVAKDYPDILFLMAHAGYMWGLKTIVQSVGHCQNVLFDLTTCPDSLSELVETCGVNRFVAGSDGPFAKPAIKHAIVESIFPNPEDQALVLGGNLVKRLGITVGHHSTSKCSENR